MWGLRSVNCHPCLPISHFIFLFASFPLLIFHWFTVIHMSHLWCISWAPSSIFGNLWYRLIWPSFSQLIVSFLIEPTALHPSWSILPFIHPLTSLSVCPSSHPIPTSKFAWNQPFFSSITLSGLTFNLLYHFMLSSLQFPSHLLSGHCSYSSASCDHNILFHFLQVTLSVLGMVSLATFRSCTAGNINFCCLLVEIFVCRKSSITSEAVLYLVFCCFHVQGKIWDSSFWLCMPEVVQCSVNVSFSSFPALVLYTPSLSPDYCQYQHHYFPALMLYTPSLFPDYCQHQSCITFLPSCCTFLHCSQIIVNTNMHYFPALMLYTPSLSPGYCQYQHAILSCPHVAHSFTVPRILSIPTCVTFLPSCCTLLHCSQIIVNTNPALLSCPHVEHSFTVPRLLSIPTCNTFLPSCCTLLHCPQIIVNTNMHYFPALMLHAPSLSPGYCQYQHAILSCPHVAHSFTVPRLLSIPTCNTFLPSCCTLLHCPQVIVNTNMHYFPALMLHTPSLSPGYCQYQHAIHSCPHVAHSFTVPRLLSIPTCITFLPSCCTLLHCPQVIVNTNPALLSCPHVAHSFAVPRLLSIPTCITFLPSCCTLLHCPQVIVNTNPALLPCPHVAHSFAVPRLLSIPTCITFLPSCCTLIHCPQVIVNTNTHYFPALVLHTPSLSPGYCQYQHALLSCPHVAHSFTVPRLLSIPTCITFLPSCCTLLHCPQVIVNTNMQYFPALVLHTPLLSPGCCQYQHAILSCPRVAHSFTVHRLLSIPTCITFLPSCCTLLHCPQVIVNTNMQYFPALMLHTPLLSPGYCQYQHALLSCPRVAHSFTVPRLLSIPTCNTFLPSCCTLLHCPQVVVNTNMHYFPALMLHTPSLSPGYCQHQSCITFLPSCCTLLCCPQVMVNTNMHYFPALVLHTPLLSPGYCQYQQALLSCPRVAHSFTVPRLLSIPTCNTFLPSCCTLLHCSQVVVNTNMHYFPALVLHTPSLFPGCCQYQHAILSCPRVAHSFTVPRLLSIPTCNTFLPSCCTLLHCPQVIVNTNMHYFPALVLHTPLLSPGYCQYQHALLSCPHVAHSFAGPRLLSIPTCNTFLPPCCTLLCCPQVIVNTNMQYFPALMLHTPLLSPGYCQYQHALLSPPHVAHSFTVPRLLSIPTCITFLPSCCTLLHCPQVIVNTNPALLSCPHVAHSFAVPRLLSIPTCITFLPSCCTLLHCPQVIVNNNMHYFPALMLYTPSMSPGCCQYQHAILSCPRVAHSFAVPRLLPTPILHYFPALVVYTPSLFPDYC